MSKTVTINEDDFFDIMTDTATKLSNSVTDAIKFGTFCTIVHNNIFSKNVDDNTEAPIKVGDMVFVTDNKGDNNHIVNQVVTVTKVTNNHDCYVTNGEHEQRIYFKNLRKVETP